MDRSRKIKILCITALLLLLTACGAANALQGNSGAASSENGAAPFCTEVFVPETPSTEPAPAETESAEASRVFTDEDFHFFLDGQGSRVDGKINVTFYPDNRNAAGEPDPNIRVWDSWQIRSTEEMRAVCAWILASEYYDPDLYGRTLDSMVTEWRAHNDVNDAYDNERTRHVDFNRADEGVRYLDFWRRAAAAYVGVEPDASETEAAPEG